MQAEQLADGGGHLVGAFAAPHRTEPLLHRMAVERLAVHGAQPPADFACRQQMAAADQRLRQKLEDPRSAFDEDLVADDGGGPLLDVLRVEHLAEELGSAGQHGARQLVVLVTRVGGVEDFLQALGDGPQLLVLQPRKERRDVRLRSLAKQIAGLAQGPSRGGDVGGARDAQSPLVATEQPGDDGGILVRVTHRCRAGGPDAAPSADGRRPVADPQRRRFGDAGNRQRSARPRVHPLEARLRVVQIANGRQRGEPLLQGGGVRRERDGDPPRRGGLVGRWQRRELRRGVEVQCAGPQPAGVAWAERRRPAGPSRRGGDGAFHRRGRSLPGAEDAWGVWDAHVLAVEERTSGIELAQSRLYAAQGGIEGDTATPRLRR